MKISFIFFLLTPFLLFPQHPWQKINGPYGGTIEGLSSNSAGELYAVNTTSLFKSTDNGSSWFFLTGEVSNINTVEISSSGRIYLGTDYRGVWWSDNNGISWNNNQIFNAPHTGLGATINDIYLNSAGHIFVAHWRSMNGGISWFELPIFARDYYFISSSEILAATNLGVQKSLNNGTSWVPLNNGLGEIQINAIDRTSTGILIAGTSSLGIYLSSDNGASWQESNSGLTNLNVIELTVDLNDKIYASTQGGIFSSTNNGSTWQSVNLGFEYTWIYDFDIINNHLYISTNEGIHRSNNNGISWNTSHHGITVLNPTTILSDNDGDIFLNASGTVYFSSNTGDIWEKRNIGYGIISLAASTNGNILAGTINSGLLISSDKGISWSNLVIPNVNRIDMIETDDMNRITISSNGKLYHSPDGASWTEIFASDTAFFVPQFLTVNNNGSMFYGGFTFFLDEVIFYSNDSGASWDSVNFGSFSELTDMYSDGENIYAAFDDIIRYSTDNGLTWQTFLNSAGSFVSSMTKLNNGIFLAATFNGIFYTSDNGNIWQSLSSGLPSTFFNFITADVNEMLYIGHYSEGVYKNDNWFNVVPVELSSFTVSVIDNDVNLNWITSTETNNSGFEIERMSSSSTNWQKIGFAAGSGTTTGNKVYSFKDNNLYPGRYSYRLKQIDYDGSFSYSDEVEIEINTPDKFALNQNYPNPFNPVTNISFQIAEPVLVSLKIFDIVGNEITVLINEQKEPGFYNLKFNASELSSGTYFYQLKAGNIIITKKLLLLK